MELITTHVGADFDGLASMLAARRLHPGARLFFPGAREASVRRMLDSGLVQIDEVRRREVDPASLVRVVLCDTRQRARLGVVAEWLAAHPGIEVVAYDHHPDAEDDVAFHAGRVDAAVGALSTLLLEELLRRRIEPSPQERDALLLGIYEDTGSLTYATTAARDLVAVAELLRRGADLAVVRRFAARALDVERLGILHRLTEALVIAHPHGHRVGVVAIELDHHVEELAPLVNRCLELCELRVLVALFGESGRIAVIARADLPGFDAGELLRELCGGGGHATAAAGGMRGVTLVEARERVLERLAVRLPPGPGAATIMVRSVRTLPAATPVATAKERLNAWRLNAAPILEEDGAVVGVAHRQGLDAALQHGLGGSPVVHVVEREVKWVAPETPLEELAAQLAALGPRLLLVGTPPRHLAGVVSRGGLLRALYGEVEAAAEPAERRARERRAVRQPAAALLARLPAALAAPLAVVAAEGRASGTEVCLVGGGVRDLLLERPVRDVDLVVVGDAPAFARRCATRLGAQVRVHEAFLTAVVTLGDGVSLDFASARSEHYRAPAALPEVQTSALRQDLYRRDFTVNTLAIRLAPQGSPELLDYFGGRRDLDEGTLRVLHALSLVDDPTRAFRAVRLELRLGFRLSRETVRLLAVAKAEGAFDRLSGGRLRAELLEILEDPSAALGGLERLSELDLLRVVDRDLEWSQSLRARLADLVAALDWYRLAHAAAADVEPAEVLLAGLAEPLGPAVRERLARRLDLAGGLRHLVTEVPRRLAAGRALGRARRLSEASDAVAGLSSAELLLLHAASPEGTRAWIRRELDEARTMKLGVRGEDLVAAGIAPGKALGRALRETRRARLDGLLGPAQEVEFAVRRARELEGEERR